MGYRINVDLEISNETGGSTDCREHPGAGRHFDITIHTNSCSRYRSGGPSTATRYGQFIATIDEAQEFADEKAKHPGMSLPHPVKVRYCRVCKPRG